VTAAPAAPPAPSDRALGDVGKGRVVVTALAESWVQVRDAAGSIVFMKIMKPGESYHAPNRRGLLLTTGNAGSIEIKVDGRAVASLGQVGRVRRDLPIDPEALLAPRAGG
jgi:cytoskeleton protein RodZ